jgi:hypothetical protein
MKFWTAFISMFFITGILQAQIPYGANNFGANTFQPYWPMTMQPYYPGATLPPYYPQAYYPQPYEVLAPYATNPISVTDNNAEIDVLTRQVEQLTDQIMQLQAQLAFVQQQPVVVTPAPPAESAEPQPPVPATPIALVFKNGARIDTQGYAISGQTLWILKPSGSERVALSQLNVAATQRENQKRGIQFPDVGN